MSGHRDVNVDACALLPDDAPAVPCSRHTPFGAYGGCIEPCLTCGHNRECHADQAPEPTTIGTNAAGGG